MIITLIIKDLINIESILRIKKILLIREINTLTFLIIKNLIDIEITLKIKKILFVIIIIIVSNFLKVFFEYVKVLF